MRRPSRPEYPFSEFLRHCDAFSRLGHPEKPSLEWSVVHLRDLLASDYPDERELVYQVGRFMLVMGYVAQHISDFDIGDYGVEGSSASGSLISENILRAVHHLFVEMEGLPKRDPSPELVLHLARKYAEGGPDAEHVDG